MLLSSQERRAVIAREAVSRKHINSVANHLRAEFLSLICIWIFLHKDYIYAKASINTIFVSFDLEASSSIC